jgi:hypothetical protein
MLVLLNACLLILFGLVGLYRPVWGFGLLILLTQTLFNLSYYIAVPLPVGYIEPIEVLIASIAIGVWRKRRAPHKARGNGTRSLDRPSAAMRRVWLAMGCYIFWQSLCIVKALGGPQGTENFHFGVRFILSSCLPWVTLYILAKMSIEDGHKVFKIAYALTIVTAIVHIAIQFTDYRPIMQAAYYVIPKEANDVAHFYEGQLQEDFVRGLPQGAILMLFFLVLNVGQFIINKARLRIGAIAATMLIFSALFITITRSFMICFLAGTLICAALALHAKCFNAKAAVRALAVCLTLVASAATYGAIRPGLLQTWSERIALLSGADSQVFSAENSVRGLENLASIAAISDHPVMGLGMPYYPQEYSLREGTTSDVHPMLMVGLVGGIPGMLLIVWLQWELFFPCLRDLRQRRKAARELVPFVSVLIMSMCVLNVLGAWGSISDTSIFSVVFFTNEMWSRRLQPSIAPSIALRGRGHARIQSTAYFDPHPVV